MPDPEKIFRSRGYRHLDAPLDPIDAYRLATNPKRVKSHSFLPFLRRELVEPRYNRELTKVVKKVRPLAYAGHADSAIFAWYGALLVELYEQRLIETGIEAIPVAYRAFSPPQCNVHFALRAFENVVANRPCIALCFDIQGFFDNLDHTLLKRAWVDLLGSPRLPIDHFHVFRRITRYASVDEAEAYRAAGIKRLRCRENNARLLSPDQLREFLHSAETLRLNDGGKGIPQGSPMSGVLSNLYMLPFDIAIHEFVANCGGFAQRYSDDILLIVPRTIGDEAILMVQRATAERQLTIQNAKTERVEFGLAPLRAHEHPPLQYLGLTFDGAHVRIRPQTLSRYYCRIRYSLRRAAEHASRNPQNRRIYRKRLNERFTHRGGKNFLGYVRNCVKWTGSEEIGLQLSRAWDLIHEWDKQLTAPPAEAV